MRATIVTLSLSAAIALLVLGGLFNAITGFGFDTVAPYNDPVRVVATFIGDTPGVALALGGLGYALYDAARRGAPGWFIGLLGWPVVPLVAASLMFAGALAYSIYWFVALAFLPLASLLYGIAALPTSATSAAIPANPAVPAPSVAVGRQTAPRSPVRFSVFVGLLALVTLGGGVLLLSPNLQPANITPSGPPVLQVSQDSTAADCASGVYPPVTLTNTGAHALQWTAHSQDPNVAANPATGSLPPFATVQVALTGKTSATDVIVQFAAGGGGGGGAAKFGCQPGTSKGRASERRSAIIATTMPA